MDLAEKASWDLEQRLTFGFVNERKSSQTIDEKVFMYYFLCNRL
jgi:hypothetical protein